MKFPTVSLKNTPLILRLSLSFQKLMFILPTVFLLYQYKGLSVGDFFLIQGLFSFATFFLEIPTGYIGDLFSRKKVIVFSVLIYLIGYVVLFLFRGFYFIFISETLLAFGLALYSGTGEAYLYDVLKKQGLEKEIIKEEGKITAYSIFATSFATFLGGVIYSHWGPDKVLLLEMSCILMALILTFFLPDIPEVKRIVEKGKSKWKDIWDISKYAAKHPEIKWLMLFPAAYAGGTLILMWGMQPLMEFVHIPVFLFGERFLQI